MFLFGYNMLVLSGFDQFLDVFFTGQPRHFCLLKNNYYRLVKNQKHKSAHKNMLLCKLEESFCYLKTNIHSQGNA